MSIGIDQKDAKHGGGFYIDVRGEIDDIERRLGTLKAKAPKVLSKALNDTARWTGRELAAEAQKRYRIQKVKFAKEFHIKKATSGNQEAVLTAKGGALPASKFKISPAQPKASSAGSPAVKLAVLKENPPKSLINSSGLLAFVAQFQSGHPGVVQRDPPRKYKSAGWSARKSRWAGYFKTTGHLDDTRIKELYGPSVPAMLHKVGVTQEFIEAQEPKILEHLQQAVTKYINTEIYFASKR